MTNKSIPEDDFWAELEEMAKDLAKGSESYVPKLQLIHDNMDEWKSYHGARADLWEYIRLLSMMMNKILQNKKPSLSKSEKEG